MIDGNDEREGYCRRLGHHLKFGYCRTVNDGLPCPRVLDCWFESFPVVEFVNEHYTPEDQRTFLAPPESKLTSILDLVRKAQERRGTVEPGN